MARTALILIFPNAGREYQGAFRKIMPRPAARRRLSEWRQSGGDGSRATPAAVA
jgi:hypothetical protein